MAKGMDRKKETKKPKKKDKEHGLQSVQGARLRALSRFMAAHG